MICNLLNEEWRRKWGSKLQKLWCRTYSITYGITTATGPVRGKKMWTVGKHSDEMTLKIWPNHRNTFGEDSSTDETGASTHLPWPVAVSANVYELSRTLHVPRWVTVTTCGRCYQGQGSTVLNSGSFWPGLLVYFSVVFLRPNALLLLNGSLITMRQNKAQQETSIGVTAIKNTSRIWQNESHLSSI